jgi:hypothetical protein
LGSATRSPYQYAGDNPLTGSDPTGLICWSVHCLLNDTAIATVAIQAVANIGMVIAAATGLEPLAGAFYAIANYAAIVNVAATCADMVTGDKQSASLSTCVGNGLVYVATSGLNMLMAPGSLVNAGGKAKMAYDVTERTVQAGVNDFGIWCSANL